MTLEAKIQTQREARTLAALIAPDVPFPYIRDQMWKRVYFFDGTPCLRIGRDSYAAYSYLTHPRIAELRKLVRAGWSGVLKTRLA